MDLSVIAIIKKQSLFGWRSANHAARKLSSLNINNLLENVTGGEQNRGFCL